MDERRRQRPLQRVQLGLHLAANFDVQRSERLVEQEDGGPDHDGPRQGDTLALAAGQLMYAAAAEALKANEGQGFGC